MANKVWSVGVLALALLGATESHAIVEAEWRPAAKIYVAKPKVQDASAGRTCKRGLREEVARFKLASNSTRYEGKLTSAHGLKYVKVVVRQSRAHIDHVWLDFNKDTGRLGAPLKININDGMSWGNDPDETEWVRLPHTDDGKLRNIEAAYLVGNDIDRRDNDLAARVFVYGCEELRGE